jgi:mRNA interferase MazF
MTPLQKRKQQYKRGDVVYACLNKASDTSSQQSGVRPCIVVSNDNCNKFSPVITIVPLTSQSKTSLPTHMILYADNVKIPDGFNLKTSLVLCEQITLIDKAQIVREEVAHVNSTAMRLVDRKIKIQLGV